MKNYFVPFLIAVIVILYSCNSSSGNHDTTNNPFVEKNPPPVDSILSPGNPFVYGIDISKYQGDEIDLMNRKGDSLSFVICKATEGLTLIDRDFKTNWDSIRARGFIKGTYHFFHSKDNVAKQSDFFISVVKSFEQSDFPPIVDFEEASIDRGSTKKAVQDSLVQFLEVLKTETGRKPLLYTDNNTLTHYLFDSKLADYPIYIAHYESVSPTLQGPWKGKKWTIWQKTHSYLIDAIQNDFDIFNGSMEDLNRFLAQR